MKKLVTSLAACTTLSAMLLVPAFAEGNMTRPNTSQNYDTRIQTNGTPDSRGVNMFRTPGNMDMDNGLFDVNNGRNDNYRTNYRTNNYRTNTGMLTRTDTGTNNGLNNIRTNNTRTGTYRANAANDNDFDWGWLGLLGLIGLAGLRGKNRERDHA